MEYASLVEIIEDAAARRGERRAVGLFGEDGATEWWTARELAERSRFVAWRLRHEVGLAPGSRILALSPSSPEVPALFFGAMRAGVVLVPLDLRMVPDVVRRVTASADASVAVVGEGSEAAQLHEAALGELRTFRLRDLAARPLASADAERMRGEVESWLRPKREDLFEIIYTSGTTGRPKGATLTHGAILAWVAGAANLIAPREHRVVSLLPLSHIFGQLAELFYALAVGAEILYVRSPNPRVITAALRAHRVTTLALVPRFIDLLWSRLEGEVERRGKRRPFETLRAVARRLPFAARRLLFRSVHRELGGSLRLIISSAAYLPPALQQAWEDLGVVVLQGYGATECGSVSSTTARDHALGTVGKPISPNVVRLADDGEVLVGGPGLFSGYWRDAQATLAAFDAEGFYRTGDLARLDARGNLVLLGRKRDLIALPSGLKVYPEDVENALLLEGLKETVVVETSPGRVEAIIHAPGWSDERVEAAVRAANRALAQYQRVQGWRRWPGQDLPRTHTLKVKRSVVREWAAAT